MTKLYCLCFQLLAGFFISSISAFSLIKFAHKYKLFQPDREEIIAIRSKKKFVPTMGGLAIFIAANMVAFIAKIDCAVLLLGNSYAILGFCDDFLKLKRNKYSGLLIKSRLFFEILFASLFVLHIVSQDPGRNYIPIVNMLLPVWLPLSALWGVWIIISAANSFNLTDGVDSLASTLGIYTLLFIAIVTNDMTAKIFIAAIAGYLIFNLPPAKLIMGDTGALGLGAVIGSLFYKYHMELFLALVGLVFVLETVSVIIQIFYIRVWHSRLFLMAPIHHHFEKFGWSKNKILLVFNIVGILALIVGLMIKQLLKLC